MDAQPRPLPGFRLGPSLPPGTPYCQRTLTTTMRSASLLSRKAAGQLLPRPQDGFLVQHQVLSLPELPVFSLTPHTQAAPRQGL